MKGLLKLHRNEQGFSLVELLIVIVILGILAAVALPNFTGITERGDEEAAATELDTIQTALDVKMADERLSSVNVTANTGDMADFPDNDTRPLYPWYMRTQLTTENYSCTTSGQVSQIATP
jgi:prepilin-type N-terminal cleavage/methylation domain-containing protein